MKYNRMRKIRTSLPLADFWRPALTALAAVAVLSSMFLYKIGSLLPGLTLQELQFRSSASSLVTIIENPLYVSNKLASLLLFEFGGPGYAPRLVSAFIGVTSVVSMFVILRHWHTTRVSVLATILFACSSWLLGTARLGTVDSAFLLPMLLLLGGIWLHRKRHVVFASLITLIAAMFLLYVPAMAWFVLPAIIWQRRRLKQALQQLSVWWQAVIIVIGVLGLAPLIWALANNPDLIRPWLGLPTSFPGPIEYLKNVARVPLAIFITREPNAVYGIANLPFTDIFTAVMAAFGTYAYAFRLKLDRTKLILASAVLGTLVIALGGPVRVSLLLPFIYILSAAGIALLLQKWFTVFPRNPFARSVAVVLMSAAIAVSCFYHLNRYFIAWPNTPQTEASFQHQP